MAIVFKIFFSFVISISVFSADVDKILDKVDELFRSDSSYGNMKMKIETPHWKRTLVMEMWTKGMDYTFVVIKSPRKDKGVSTLKRKNEMWNYFPKINKVIKIPPSMMMGSWMGSDLTNDDLVKESSLRKDYNSKLEDKGKEYFITLTPKKNTVSVWGKIELIIEKGSLLPIKQIYYDEKNVAIRNMIFKDVKKLGGKTIPAVMEVIPLTEDKKGNKTTMIYEDMTFNIKIDDNTFTRQNLQKRR
jgi:outer membrane lipoprotein-sorting protein